MWSLSILVNSSLCLRKLSSPGFSGCWIILFFRSLLRLRLTLWASWAAQFLGRSCQCHGFFTKLATKGTSQLQWFYLISALIPTLSANMHCSSHMAVMTWFTSSDISFRNQCAYWTLVVPIEWRCNRCSTMSTTASDFPQETTKSTSAWAQTITVKEMQLSDFQCHLFLFCLFLLCFAKAIFAHLFWAEFMCGLHEVGTQHWERHAESVLGRKLHALLELVLEDWRVETAEDLETEADRIGAWTKAIITAPCRCLHQNLTRSCSLPVYGQIRRLDQHFIQIVHHLCMEDHSIHVPCQVFVVSQEDTSLAHACVGLLVTGHTCHWFYACFFTEQKKWKFLADLEESGLAANVAESVMGMFKTEKRFWLNFNESKPSPNRI